ncbi:MAG: acetyltransferase [Lachnospiraceae bacterium]|nr:acetyltransferase [Lachnospiraceae bacterium]
MIEKVLLIGGGGHCHSVIDSIVRSGFCKEIGIVESDEENFCKLKQDAILAPYLIGIDDDLPDLYKAGWTKAFISLGSVGNTKVRRKIFSNARKIGFELITVIDSSAVVSNTASIGAGSFIGKRAVVNSGTKIGSCAIINTGSVIEHDCLIGNFAHVSPGAVICGQVKIGDDSHLGAGSVVRQMISIGTNSLIGIGSVVVKDVPDDVEAYGNPCRVIKRK